MCTPTTSQSEIKSHITKKFKLHPIISNLLFITFFSLVCFGLLILGNEFSKALIGASIILGFILNYLHSIFKELVNLNLNLKNEKSNK